MMVVTDGRRARSLAGIMGGEDSEIADSTRDVIIEGANWDRATIRRTSAALTLASEASRRFGRGVDPDLTTLGVARATELTLELAGGAAAVGMADEYPGRQALSTIDVEPRQIDSLLGLSFPRAQVVATLDSLGFAPSDGPNGSVHVTVPGWRRFDVEGPADLAEEVGRIAGFDLVPTTMPEGALPTPRPDGDRGFGDELRARRRLAAAGLQEVITYSLVDPDLASLLELDGVDNGARPRRLSVANPQSVELSELRPNLLGSLLLALRSNLRQRNRVLLFELARIWRPNSEGSEPSPEERRHVGITMVGPRSPRHWEDSSQPLDFFDVKGVVDALCAGFGVTPEYTRSRHPSLHPGRTAEVCSNGSRLGVLGQVHPTVAERFDLSASGFAVMFAELDFDRLVLARQPLEHVSTPSRFPAADRDISFFIDESTPHAELLATIRESAGELLEQVELFDVFRGGSVPEGKQSLAFALRYRAADRTLEDNEVTEAHLRVEDALRTRFGAEIRGRS
jgi:phenylalanyl-tRNA synthetase beta chain